MSKILFLFILFLSISVQAALPKELPSAPAKFLTGACLTRSEDLWITAKAGGVCRLSGQEMKPKWEDNRNKGRRGEAGIAEPRIQHGQILHFDVTSRIKWRISSRKSQKKLFPPSLSLDKMITKAYFMVTKNRIRRFLTVKNPNTLSKTN